MALEIQPVLILREGPIKTARLGYLGNFAIDSQLDYGYNFNGIMEVYAYALATG
jgi:hypothetical protein